MPRPKVLVRPILTELSRDVNNSEALTENFLQQTALGIKATLQKYLERELVDQRTTSRGDYSIEDRSCQYPRIAPSGIVLWAHCIIRTRTLHGSLLQLRI